MRHCSLLHSGTTLFAVHGIVRLNVGGNREMRIQIMEMKVGAFGESNVHPVSHKWAVMLEIMQNVLWKLFD